MHADSPDHTHIEYTILCVWNSNFLQGGIFGIWKVVIWDSRSSAELLLVGCACARALACSCGARQSGANDLAGGRQAASVTALVRCSTQSARYVSSSCGGDHRAERCLRVALSWIMGLSDSIAVALACDALAASGCGLGTAIEQS